jgi:hypothetical protein
MIWLNSFMETIRFILALNIHEKCEISLVHSVLYEECPIKRCPLLMIRFRAMIFYQQIHFWW